MIIILSISPKGERLKDALLDLGEKVIIISEVVKKEHIEKYKPSFVISHGYDKLVSSEVIDLMKGHIINMHPSMLPVNRGMFPNFWSFIYDTPKGFTIHNMSSKLDTGDILIQKEIEESMHETLIDNWLQIKRCLIQPRKQQGMSTFHNLRKFNEFKTKIPFNWEDNIYEFLKNNNEEIQQFIKSYQ